MNTLRLIITAAFLLSHFIVNAQTYTTPGTYTWVVPPCVTTITVKVWGGGGGGGGTSSRQSNTGDEACTEGGGGGGGGFSMRTYSVTPGETYTIVVGAGGNGGVGANNTAVAGATGGTSTFTGPATVPFGSLTGFGGIGGGGATANNNNSGSHIGANGAGGTGGTGANGTTIFTGGNGSAGSHSAGCADISGAGGGGAGTTGNGANGQYIGACPHTTAMAGGAGAASNGGNGANGIKNNISSKHNQNGNAGSAYGGGGGGSGIHLNTWANQWVLANGGAGAAGAVLIEYSASGAPVDPTIGITAASCSSAGSATVSNYNGSYTYSFSPSGPTIGAGGAISGATPGTAYTITGNNGACNSNAASFTVPTQLPTPATPTLSTNAASCSSAGTSTVTNYSGGNTYSFSPSGPTIGAGGAISGATPGTTYNVTAGNGGCTSSPVSFTNAAQLPATATPMITTIPATCSATGSGSVSNYNAGNSYSFSPSGPTIGAGGTISGANPGTAYTVTGNNGTCNSAPASFTISAQLPTPATPAMSTNPASCSSAGTSTVTNYSGGNTYSFSPSGPTVGAGGAITGATPGTTYNITAGNGGCTSSPASFTNAAQLPATATPMITTIPATCSATGSGSVSNYNAGNSYSFSPSGPIIGAGGAITGANPGTSYTVTGNNGTCNSTPASFTISAQLPTPVAPTMSTNPASCSSAGTSVVTNYNAGNTYTFSPSGPTIGAGGAITGATPGTTYNITAGNSGCTSAPASFNNAVQLPATPDPAINTNPATCLASGQSTITNYNATYTYTFSPSGPIVGAGDIINGATPGIAYSVTSTNNGCVSAPVSFTNDVQLPLAPDPVIQTDAATCTAPGSSMITNYNSGYVYTFSPVGPIIGAGGEISGSVPGTSYDVSSSNGSCSSSPVSFSDAAQLISPAQPVINTTTATCSTASSSTVSNYNGTYNYTFAPGGPAVGVGGLITGSSPGTSYIVTVSNGVCTEDASFVNAPQLISPATPIVNTISASCVSDGSSSVSNYDASLTYTFTPAGPSLGTSGQVIGAVTGTSYSIIASNGTCSSSQASFINDAQLPDLPVPSVSTSAATCTAPGLSTITNFNQTSVYTFTPSGPTVDAGGAITGAIPGVTYTVGASDAGCTSPVVSFMNGTQLTVPDQPVAISGNVNLSCGTTSEDYFVTNIPGVTYSWSYSGGGTISGSGSFITLNSITSGGVLTVVPSNACGNGTPQIVGINLPDIQLSVGSISPSCTNSATGSATVSATGGTSPYQYQWNPTGGTAATATNLAAGTYTVTVTDQAGCNKNIQVTITAIAPINLNLSSTGIYCSSSSLGTATTAPSGGTAPYVYHWSNNETTPTISSLASGTYSVTVTDANNCQSSGSIAVDLINDLSVHVTPENAVISEGDSIQLNAVVTPSVPGSTYSWMPANSVSCSNCPNPVAFPSETTTYEVTVVTPAGCSVDTTITIIVNPVCGEMEVPNIFTPNGDQLNDLYELNTTCLIELEYWILNRWGNTIFHASELNTSWDGKIDSQPASEGVYFIKYVAKNSAGKEIKGQTFFHLSR